MSPLSPLLPLAVVLSAVPPRAFADGGQPAPAEWAWVNQEAGPRPSYAWENREDVIYHDLAYADQAVASAPEFAPFLGRAWVFNRAMQWHREPEGILCYSDPATLPLTGTEAVSAWHSDPANGIAHDGEWTVFTKRAGNRRRDCAVLPAFQFHVRQNPACELEVAEAKCDWQFVVSVKGRGGPPLLASEWRTGPGAVQFDLAGALRARGFDLHYAELHFVIGVWADSEAAPASIRFRLWMPGQPALVPCLPIVRTARRASEAGAPLLVAAMDAQGRRIGRDGTRVRADVEGRTIELEERGGLWRASLRDLGVGDHVVHLAAEGAVNASATTHLRITDGRFWGLDRERGLFALDGRVPGPLSGSYQGNVFVRNARSAREALVQGQEAWNAWDRTAGAGEHLFYWEGLTPKEMDERFAYLAACGWDLLHVCQNWGIWERLDAGGRIAPHGAEQIALYLRTAGRHGLAVIQALTHYEYVTAFREWHGTVPFTTYLDAGFEDADFFVLATPARRSMEALQGMPMSPHHP